MNNSAANGTMPAAKGIALAPSELSTTAPPIIPPTAFAILKAEMFAVAASSGAAFPYFMTRICIGATLAKDATPKMKAAARNGHLNGATSPTTIRDATIAAGHRMSERRRFASAVRAIRNAEGPVVLVGHSWAGVVITEAGNDDKVQSLVYVAAYAPDKGESLQSHSSRYPDLESLSTFVKDQDGYLTISDEGIKRYFAAHLSAKELPTFRPRNRLP
jgi:pimeloyl-ACP methyl ester carboxylesterase